ncbi:MAG: hypothetical protein RLZZ124_998 [Cyanobacteriota bacterium]
MISTARPLHSRRDTPAAAARHSRRRRTAAGVVSGLLAMAALTALLPPAPARALPEAEVMAKLDSVLLLMAIDGQGQPKAMTANIDGKPVKAYLAAISIAAAEEIKAGKRFGLAEKERAELRFTPVSLARFNRLVMPLLQQKQADVGAVAPDPGQMALAEQLLISQKLPAAQARAIAAQQPMIFCPEPGLEVSASEGANKGKPFVPCSTDGSFVQAIVQRGIKESPQLAKANARVIAIPLNAFIAYLGREPAERVGLVRVVPSAGLVQLVQQLSKQTRPPAAPAK